MITRIASNYLASLPLGRKTRSKVNQALSRAGMDGNQRFSSVGQALSRAWGILSEEGIEQGEVVNANRFLAQSGAVSISLAWSNEEDPFSPSPVPNSNLYVQWTVLERGIEVIAYLT